MKALRLALTSFDQQERQPKLVGGWVPDLRLADMLDSLGKTCLRKAVGMAPGSQTRCIAFGDPHPCRSLPNLFVKTHYRGHGSGRLWRPVHKIWQNHEYSWRVFAAHIALCHRGL